MALDTLWIAFTSILSMYDISKHVDGNGNIDEPGYEPVSASLVL
jgi:hypothetical protein